nr:hypothetical protein [Tanacetum cinerariifolium]
MEGRHMLRYAIVGECFDSKKRNTGTLYNVHNKRRIRGQINERATYAQVWVRTPPLGPSGGYSLQLVVSVGLLVESSLQSAAPKGVWIEELPILSDVVGPTPGSSSPPGAAYFVKSRKDW